MLAAVATSTVPRQSPGGQDSKECSSSLSSRHEAAVRDVFLFNWRVLAIVSGAITAVLVTTEFHIVPLGYLVVFAIAALYWQFGSRHWRTDRWNPRVSFCLMALGQMTFAIAIMTTLTYLAMSIELPLQDKRLLDWDLALGLDFRKYLDWTSRHPRLIQLMAPSYSSISWQMTAVAIALPLFGHYRRAGEAVFAFTLSLLMTTCISVLVPAIGVYDTLGLTPADHPHIVPQGYYDTARDVPLLRSSSLRLLDLPRLSGVLTFPSFHAVAAIFFIWAFWPVVWLRLLAIPLNVAMLAATPLGGGHYFVDVLAGIAVAVVAIVAARRLGEHLAPRAPTFAGPAGGKALPARG